MAGYGSGRVIRVPGTNCTLFENCYDGHEGYDFDDWACYGNVVYPAAAADIVTSETGWRNDGYGNRVVIQHGNSGYKTLYGHLSNILVTSGDVNLDTQIGIMGETGCPNCGTHLHFNAYYNGQLVDPSGWDGSFNDPYVEEGNGPESYRQWLYPVRRRTPVNYSLGTDFVAPSGNTIAYIPANAYSEDFELSVTELPPLWIPGHLASAGHAALFSAQSVSGDPINEFDNSFTLEIRFDETDVAGIDTETLAIYFWDSDMNNWIPLPTNTSMSSQLAGIDVTQNSGTAHRCHAAIGLYILIR